ncbi:MAG: CHASE2 domain-containing protein [Candidatus Omnitrophota bacterium]
MLRNLYNVIYQNAVKYKRGVVWILALAVTAIILIVYQTNILDRFELLTLDYRFNLRNHRPGHDDIVFIDMAEDSINVIGRWPWPRKWHAALIKILSPYKPRAIAFDVIFSEPQDETDDAALEESIRQAGVVYMPSVYDIEMEKSATFYKGDGVVAIHEPLDRFRGALKGSGHINAVPDSDGILRRAPPAIKFRDKTTYQLGIKIGADLLGVREEDISFDPAKRRISLKLPGGMVKSVPLDNRNQLIVNWIGKWGKDFAHYSYIDVIKSYASLQEGAKPLIDLNVFKDKICVIGLTAAGLIDIKPIPIESAYPAVGTNAMIVSSVLKNDFIREVPDWVNLLILVILSISATVALCDHRLLSGIMITVVSIVVYAALSAALFSVFNVVVVTFYPILAIGFSYVMTASYTQILQSIERVHLFKQATRDGLTQLYNIRHFNLLFEAEFRNASTLKFRALSVIMADIDNFKHANDTYGHQAGDLILRDVANIIQSKCRALDVVGRYGGEEFIVMLSGAKAVDAMHLAEKIRSAVEERKFRIGNVIYSTTISLGVAEYSDEATKNELAEKADKALYYSKKNGKNQATAYSPEILG